MVHWGVCGGRWAGTNTADAVQTQCSVDRTVQCVEQTKCRAVQTQRGSSGWLGWCGGNLTFGSKLFFHTQRPVQCVGFFKAFGGKKAVCALLIQEVLEILESLIWNCQTSV